MLFLDEIGDLPTDVRVKLLRFLDQRTFYRVGNSTEQIEADLQVVTATNRDLETTVREGQLRQDFYYRIKNIEIYLPPLRERTEDIPLIASHFLHLLQKQGRTRISTISPEALVTLCHYAWHGNVRELRSVIEGITISGGEPFEQDITALGAFLQLVKEAPRQLSVMCYTGKQLVELQNDGCIAEILGYIDILVDGPYINELNDGHKWRGSSNQRIYPLNAKYADIVREAESSFDRGIEINLSAKMQLELTGIPNGGFVDDFERKLQERGYSLLPSNK